ncbi:MAG: tetratricopeptide repeat protein [Chitinophagaceae bacterium]|nr:tetratricopeptide repeat protein [Chitinophagaceae bacterium]
MAPGTSNTDDGHTDVNIDTFLVLGKKKLKAEQVVRINELEHSISRGDVKDQQLKVYQQLAKFWYDSANAFEPYAWYTGEAARLENSEKSLTFAAQLFLNNLQQDEVFDRRKWKALQAKDLFERSLKLNPDNDSAKIGLGSCYLFGNISASPMEGILKIREVTQKDSNNVYAQMMLGKASLLSGQFDKAEERFKTILRIKPQSLDALLLLGEIAERKADKKAAIDWYTKSLPLVKIPELKAGIEKRIADLQK